MRDYQLKGVLKSEVIKKQRQEEDDEGVTRTYEDHIQITKKVEYVRQGVLDRREWKKFGSKKDEERGVFGKEVVSDNQIKIQTTQDLEKADIEIVKRIKNLNTDKIRAQKLQQQLKEKDEKKDPKEEMNYLLAQTQQSSQKVDRLTQLATMASTNECRIIIKDLMIDNKEEKELFKEQLQNKITAAGINTRFFIDIRQGRRFRDEYYAFINVNDRAYAEQIVAIFQNETYNNTILDVKIDTPRPYVNRRNNDNNNNNNRNNNMNNNRR